MGEVRRFTNLTTGGPVYVDVQDDKILRIIPLQLDDSDGPSWTIEAGWSGSGAGLSRTRPRST